MKAKKKSAPLKKVNYLKSGPAMMRALGDEYEKALLFSSDTDTPVSMKGLPQRLSCLQPARGVKPLVWWKRWPAFVRYKLRMAARRVYGK